ncbi:MAG: sulfite exporter TauE/SafE family protein [Candidatus Omnitrophica bacterium]|nr:sulfite exporter TauE/SafE family protein [Candidatus Omnitrophota bacterium]
MFDLTFYQWLVSGLSAVMIGLAKTGLPGIGILAIPLMAWVLPARASTGVVLPMLIFADFFAVGCYRRFAVWPKLVRLLPWAAVGVFLGYLALGRVNDQQLKPIIGGIVLVMLALNFWRNDGKEDRPVPTWWWFAALFGLLAGVTTMMANAAGPVMAIYLLAMRLSKNEFIGTGAWYFLLVNCFKVPFSAHLGLINSQSFHFNLVLFPLVALGALAGMKLLKHIPEKVFNYLVQGLAALAAINLLF